MGGCQKALSLTETVFFPSSTRTLSVIVQCVMKKQIRIKIKKINRRDSNRRKSIERKKENREGEQRDGRYCAVQELL